MNPNYVVETEEMKALVEKVLKAYAGYYNVNRSTPLEPFAAEAEFRLHDEQYFLIKSAKVSEADSREFVYFATVDRLDKAAFEELDRISWEDGLSRAEIGEHHRNSDVSLVILANHVDPDAAKLLKKTRHYKSYRFGLRGWSDNHTIVYELSTGKETHNRTGDHLAQVFKQ